VPGRRALAATQEFQREHRTQNFGAEPTVKGEGVNGSIIRIVARSAGSGSENGRGARVDCSGSPDREEAGRVDEQRNPARGARHALQPDRAQVSHGAPPASTGGRFTNPPELRPKQLTLTRRRVTQQKNAEGVMAVRKDDRCLSDLPSVLHQSLC
jgi:hypothetical protein